MAAVMAGWAAGYAMAILSTAAFTHLLVKAKDPGIVGRWLGEGSPTLLVAVPASIGTVLAWTMIGLALGSMYEVTDAGAQMNALGSPSAPFLIGVAAIALIPVPMLALFWRRHWWLWCGMSGAFLGLFGWLMPILAER